MNIKRSILIILKPAIFLIAGFTIAQQDHLDRAVEFLNNAELDSAWTHINRIDYQLLSEYDQGLVSFYRGMILKKQDQHPNAYSSYRKALAIFSGMDSLADEADTNYEIYDLLIQQNSLKINPSPYLEKYFAYAQRSGDTLALARAYSKIAGVHWDNGEYDKAKSYFHQTIDLLKQINDTLRVNSIMLNLGSVNISAQNGDSALYYYRKTLPYFKKIGNNYIIATNYNNQGRAYEILKDTFTAIEFYERALAIDISEYSDKTTAEYLNNIIRCYAAIGNYPKAYDAAQRLIDLNIKIDDVSQNQALIDAEKKYEASEKERLRLRNQNIAIALGGGLLAVSLLGFLIYKNAKRKQRIAEQEKEIEIQKKEKILKEQELNAIDAMIAGQEKERQRLASDLHDSVGATLSAAKLQFDHLAKNKNKLDSLDELIEKTGSLLDDAYTEVRSMAHLKNSGVIAKKGLLPAVEKLAKNASTHQSLQIEVQDFGLTEKLEPSLEISIFRIIQELVTNIIKHAQATEANISITQHDDNLSIIIEDNGKGFDPRQIQRDKGMGLASIEKRVEHLEGSMEVDSTPGKGTNILIDIPI